MPRQANFLTVEAFLFPAQPIKKPALHDIINQKMPAILQDIICFSRVRPRQTLRYRNRLYMRYQCSSV